MALALLISIGSGIWLLSIKPYDIELKRIQNLLEQHQNETQQLYQKNKSNHH